jgi:hypothetical protein
MSSGWCSPKFHRSIIKPISGQKVSQASLHDSTRTLKMEADSSPETKMNLYRAARCYISEDTALQILPMSGFKLEFSELTESYLHGLGTGFPDTKLLWCIYTQLPQQVSVNELTRRSRHRMTASVLHHIRSIVSTKQTDIKKFLSPRLTYWDISLPPSGLTRTDWCALLGNVKCKEWCALSGNVKCKDWCANTCKDLGNCSVSLSSNLCPLDYICCTWKKV